MVAVRRRKALAVAKAAGWCAVMIPVALLGGRDGKASSSAPERAPRPTAAGLPVSPSATGR